MDARDAGGVVGVHGPPPRTLIAAGLWLSACGWMAVDLDGGLVASVAVLLASPVGLVCCMVGVFRALRDASLRRTVRRAGASPWEARGLWTRMGTTLAGPLRQRAAPDRLDWHEKRAFAGTATLVVLVAAPSVAWRFAVVVAYLLFTRIVGPKTCAAARITFDAFPLRAGERARFRVQLARRAPAEPFDTVQFLLRCVAETPRFGGWVRPDVRCVLALPAVGSAHAAPDTGPFDLEFEIPADAPGTDLAARGPVYWELVVHAESPAWIYEQSFRVPLYAAPAGVTT